MKSLAFIESYFTRYYWKSWEHTKLANVIIIQHRENHIHQEEKVSVVKGGQRYQPSVFSLNSIFNLKAIAAIFPRNNPGPI